MNLTLPSLTLALMACCGLARAADAPESPAALMAPIKTLVGDAECDNQTQCKIAGIGAKACGGPDSYIAWSTKNTDVAALRSAVEAQSKAQAADNVKRGLASNCALTPEPTAVCRARPDGKKVCQLGQGGIGSPE